MTVAKGHGEEVWLSDVVTGIMIPGNVCKIMMTSTERRKFTLNVDNLG